MAFRFERSADAHVKLRLTGDIDLEITPDIREQVYAQINDARAFVIDARDVSYIDSSGISILVIALQSCRKNKIPFSIDAASNELMHVVKLAKLDHILPIDDTTGPANSSDADAPNDGDKALPQHVSDDELIADLAKSPADPDAQNKTKDEKAKTKSPEPAPTKAPKENKNDNANAIIKPGTFS